MNNRNRLLQKLKKQRRQKEVAEYVKKALPIYAPRLPLITMIWNGKIIPVSRQEVILKQYLAISEAYENYKKRVIEAFSQENKGL